MNQQQREALIDIAEMGYNLPPHEVAMNHWWCGTTGCVLGHAIKRLPTVQSLLRLVEWGDPTREVFVPAGLDGKGTNAVTSAFELSCGEVMDIFCQSRNSIEVSDKIMDYLGVAHI